MGLRKGWAVLLDAVEHWLATDPTVDPHVVITGVRQHSNKQESIEYEQVLLQRGKHGPLSGRHLVGYWTPIDQFLQEIDLDPSSISEPLRRSFAGSSSTGNSGWLPPMLVELQKSLVNQEPYSYLKQTPRHGRGVGRVLKEPNLVVA